MNVFATFPDPIKCARVLDDQRVVKMMAESVQILSTALHAHDAWISGLPKPTHAHHPVVQWAGTARENAQWLWEHALALQDEWRWRFAHPSDRTHKSIGIASRLRIHRQFKVLPRGFTTHVNCAANKDYGISFKHITDVYLAYRMYLSARWRIQAENHPRMRLAVATVNFHQPRFEEHV